MQFEFLRNRTSPHELRRVFPRDLPVLQRSSDWPVFHGFRHCIEQPEFLPEFSLHNINHHNKGPHNDNEGSHHDYEGPDNDYQKTHNHHEKAD